MEDDLGLTDRIRYVEQLGPTIGDVLITSDPWKNECGRNCILCKTKPGDCCKKGVVYEIICQTCEKQGIKSSYYGETARTAWERSLEHLALWENHPEASAIEDHQREVHDGLPKIEIGMKVVAKFFKPLERQTKEGQMVNDFKGHHIFNRKGEWGENVPPKFGLLEDGALYTTVKRKRANKSTKSNIEVENQARKRVKISEESVHTEREKSETSEDTENSVLTVPENEANFKSVQCTVDPTVHQSLEKGGTPTETTPMSIHPPLQMKKMQNELTLSKSKLVKNENEGLKGTKITNYFGKINFGRGQDQGSTLESESEPQNESIKNINCTLGATDRTKLKSQGLH